DPGLAFGTGTHPTTWLCLNWLDSQPLQGKTVIDYGCGSGILGIAALLLGAERMIAVDIDPQALQATRDNAQRNNIDPARIDCYLPEDLPEVLKGDVLLANILAGPLLELAPALAETIPAGAPVCLSGILDTQGDGICERYSQWFEQFGRQQREEWLRITAVKKG
ncbi:50S ribosomal protein L11 methyltransferase, partial [Spongiibacter sp. UBA6593]